MTELLGSVETLVGLAVALAGAVWTITIKRPVLSQKLWPWSVGATLMLLIFALVHHISYQTARSDAFDAIWSAWEEQKESHPDPIGYGVTFAGHQVVEIRSPIPQSIYWILWALLLSFLVMPTVQEMLRSHDED